MAAARPTTSTRWVVGIMVAALLASVLVVVGLIEITGQSPSSAGGSSESPAPSAGASDGGSAGASDGGSANGTAGGSGAPSAGPDASATAGPSASASGTAGPTTTPVVLAGSGLDLPAAWTGTADMTITVQGKCAETGGTSFYTRPAQFALQVSPTAPATVPASTPAGASGSAGSSASAVPGGVTGGSPAGPDAGPAADPAGGTPDQVDPVVGTPAPSPTTAVPPVPAGPVSMTLGITSTDVPGLSLYSTSSSRDGSIRRTWVVDTAADPATPDRTSITATLADDQPLGGALPPNLLVDSETDLLPCETGNGVRLPRPLARGATVTGWVSATQAVLDIAAVTTDGERTVQAHLDLTRTPGS
ncbi:hypothetical protein [Nakamurella sp.]|uniref:hypothetical protein n=1 Tax=Nakamurella sp. TaxID=1869182 RepID=UPI003B3B3096